MSKKKIVWSWIYICISVAVFIYAILNHYNPVEIGGQTNTFCSIAFLIIAAPFTISYVKSIRMRMVEANGIVKLFVIIVGIMCCLIFSSIWALIATVKTLITTIAATVRYKSNRHDKNEARPEKITNPAMNEPSSKSNLINEGQVDVEEIYRCDRIENKISDILDDNCELPVELWVEKKQEYFKLTIEGVALYDNRVALLSMVGASKKTRVFFYEPKVKGLYEIKNPITIEKIIGLLVRVGNGKDDFNTQNIACYDYYFSYDDLPRFIEAGSGHGSNSFKTEFSFDHTPTADDDYSLLAGKEFLVRVYRRAKYRGLDCYIASSELLELEHSIPESLFVAAPFSFCGEMRINIIDSTCMEFGEILRNVFPEYVTYSWANMEK